MVGKNTDNPWLAIPAADYEGHMGAGGVDQLAPLRAIFADLYARVRPARLAVLGCGPGNGLDVVDPAVTRRFAGVDLSADYLSLARERHPRLAPIATWICSSADRCDLEAAGFDLIHAALLLEYIDASAVVPRIAGWLAPGGVFSVVLQLPGGDARISATGFASLRTLSRPHAAGRSRRASGPRDGPRSRRAVIAGSAADARQVVLGRDLRARGRLVASVRLLRNRERRRRCGHHPGRVGERQLAPVLAPQEQQVHQRVEGDARRPTGTRSSAARTRSRATSGYAGITSRLVRTNELTSDGIVLPSAWNMLELTNTMPDGMKFQATIFRYSPPTASTPGSC